MKLSPAYKKNDLIKNLRMITIRGGAGIEDEYGHADFHGSRTTMLMAAAVADWLEENAPHEEHGNILAYIGDFVVSAYEDFRALPKYADLRAEYVIAMGGHRGEIPCLLTPTMDGLLEGMSIARVVGLASGQDWVKQSLERDFGAQMEVINQAWRAFVRRAYRPLIRRIKDESHRGNRGTFGETELLAYACAGRVMFTFQRRGGEIQATYVADDSDMLGHRSGGNHPGCDFTEAVAMIRDVTAHWDMDKFVKDDKIGFGF